MNVLVTIDLPKALMGLTTNIEEMELGIAALEEKVKSFFPPSLIVQKTAVLAETEESERLLKELIQQFQQKTGEGL